MFVPEEKDKKANKSFQPGLESINEKFGSGVDLYVEEMKTHGAGLSTNADFKKRRYRAILEAHHSAAAPSKPTKTISKEIPKVQAAATSAKKREAPTLSFLDEDEEPLAIPVNKRKKVGKDPSAETSFLPDAEREQKLEEEKQRLIEQFMEEQKRIQNETCELTFAYSEYPNAKRTVRVKKSADIGTIINECKAILAKDFKNLENLPGEGLMFTKENIILPKECTIYDSIVDKVKGASGDLLFDFVKRKETVKNKDGTEETVEIDVDKGAVARITERKKYEKDKHLFPYRLWKHYNPAYIENP